MRNTEYLFDASADERRGMIETQIRKRGVSSARVLEAMAAVPRHEFVPVKFRDDAYADKPLPIGAGQTISQPYMVAAMTEALQLAGSERVLEIGTGSGYQAAVLARLAREVYSIECIEGLQDRARVILNAMGVTNVFFKCADGSEGWPEMAPFDAILVTAAMPGIPRPLLEQLAPNGRLVAPIGEDELQTLVRISRSKGSWREEYFGECRFVKMTGKHGFKD